MTARRLVGDEDTIRISAVIMHHPSRGARLPALLARLAELNPRVIPDPKPSGPPSPLRTAKLAWAAIAPGATHHLVLQDDITPAPDIGRQLHRAVTANPDCGISLYVNWNSPQNSYLVRRAAVTGSPWAPLSPLEYTPTLGLVLPVAHAAALAAHLAALPDVLKDDDEVVTPFRIRRGLPAVASVPHLLEHGDERSTAGNDSHGRRRATVYAPGLDLDTTHWTAHLPTSGAGIGTVAVTRAGAATTPGMPDYAVEFVESTCQLRLVQPLAREPIEHGFGWYWYDWCALIGVERDRIVETWRTEPAADEHHSRLGLEFWAACYLLGADAWATRSHRDASLTAHGELARRALESWVRAGLAARDRRALSEGEQADLVDLGARALWRGWLDRAAAGTKWPAVRHVGRSESAHV
ncbi:hypothetical protein [Streptomyces sp. NPDC048248]|uniref:hypothetical protein n=1 Tax=Streptomyces sp. NPDC048248 TaxID=3365523 RepID=UPI003723247B